jgi:hypothetical protein
MAAATPPAAWAARTSGLASTSGRAAAHAVPMQPRATAPSPAASLSGSGGAARRVPPPQAVGQRPLRAVLPGSFAARPPAGVPLQQPAGGAPATAQQLRPFQQGSEQQQQQQQAAGAQQGGMGASAAPSPTAGDGDGVPGEHEMRRRQKISAANKGRTPWNKGLKHPPEVRGGGVDGWRCGEPWEPADHALARRRARIHSCMPR